MLVYFVLSTLAGVFGGVYVSQFMRDYRLGFPGDIIAGFTGGAAAHVLVMLTLGGSAVSVAFVGGFLSGVIVRAGFSVLRYRTGGR